jgi:tetratricopeptide (TPR) repeat protein
MIAAALLTSSAHAQQPGRWLRAETEGFVVYGAGSEQAIRSVSDQLERFDALLRRLTGATGERSPTEVEVYLLDRRRFQDTFPHLGDNIVGLYAARPDQIAAFAIFSDTRLDGQDVLYHEYAHHFMRHYFANAYPAWYVEGFAEFVSTAIIGTERIELGRSNEDRFYSLRNDAWMPMERLLTAAPFELSSSDMATFYAQSWLFTHYLVLTNKMPQFQAYVRALRLGEDPIAAFQAGFSMTPDQMQAELRRYFRSSPNALALGRPANVDVMPPRVTRLPASADDLLPVLARLRYGVSERDAPALLQSVRQLAGAAPGDPFALLTLAYAEATIGDPAAARALLEPHLANSPDDVAALNALGRAYLSEARGASGDARLALLAQARRNFARAHRIDENNVPALYGYAESYDGVMMSGETWDNYLNVLLLSHQLAPQIDEITLNAASALMGHNRHAEAIPLLRMVAYDPHGGSGAQIARQMLEQAEAAAAQ